MPFRIDIPYFSERSPYGDIREECGSDLEAVYILQMILNFAGAYGYEVKLLLKKHYMDHKTTRAARSCLFVIGISSFH